MENPNFDTQEYRDNLAKDLKDIRKADKEKAQDVLEEEKETIRYGEASKYKNESEKENLESKSNRGENGEIFIPLKSLDYKNLIYTLKIGDTYMNPECRDINWSSINPEKIKSLSFKGFGQKYRSELATQLIQNYSDKYIITDLSYREFLMKNPDKIPPSLKDGNFHYFYGSVFRGSDDNVRMPNIRWLNGELTDRVDPIYEGCWDDPTGLHQSENIVLLER